MKVDTIGLSFCFGFLSVCSEAEKFPGDTECLEYTNVDQNLILKVI